MKNLGDASMNDCDQGCEGADRKIYGLLSLCKKAGKLCGGDLSVMDSIKSGKAQLVLIATDAADNAKKKYEDKCAYRRIPYSFFGEKEKLGNATGAGERAAIAITDPGFAQTVRKRLATNERKGESNGKDQNI